MRTPFSSACLALLCSCFFFHSSLAQAQALDCQASNMTQADQLGCRVASLRWTMETVETLHIGLAKRLEDHTRQALMQEHLAWKAYRDSKCGTGGRQVLQTPEENSKARCVRDETEERLVTLAHRLQSFHETQTSLLGPRDRSVLTGLLPKGLYQVDKIFFVHADAFGDASQIQALRRETLLYNNDRMIFNGETCVKPTLKPYGVDVTQLLEHFYGKTPLELMPSHPMPGRALVLELDCSAGSIGPKNLLLVKGPGRVGLIYHDTAYVELQYLN